MCADVRPVKTKRQSDLASRTTRSNHRGEFELRARLRLDDLTLLPDQRLQSTRGLFCGVGKHGQRHLVLHRRNTSEIRPVQSCKTSSILSPVLRCRSANGTRRPVIVSPIICSAAKALHPPAACTLLSFLDPWALAPRVDGVRHRLSDQQDPVSGAYAPRRIADPSRPG